MGEMHKGTGRRKPSDSNYHRMDLELTLCGRWVVLIDCLAGARIDCRKCVALTSPCYPAT